jgi:hypothetical protein
MLNTTCGHAYVISYVEGLNHAPPTGYKLKGRKVRGRWRGEESINPLFLPYKFHLFIKLSLVVRDM